MRARWFIIAGPLLLVVAAAAWWLSNQHYGTAATPRPDPAPTSEMVAGPVEPTPPEVALGSEEINSAKTNVAKRIKHVPDSRKSKDDAPSTDLRDLTAENVVDLIQTNLNLALKGELASAYFVTRSKRLCERFASTSGDLEKRIRRTNRKVENDIKRGRDLPANKDNGLPWSASWDEEDNRAQLENWYDACQRMQSMFTPDLRRQLELLALKGDVMAAYLYASWPLDQLDMGEAFDQQFRWESLARDFSQTNMDKGEVAGLMAFAQSYMNGWFTARNGDLALAFSIAALNCGFETNSSQNFISKRIDQLMTSQDPADQQRLQFALTEAERLGSICVP